MTKKEYGDFEVEGDLDIKKAKVKVTMYLDGDILDKARTEAKTQHTRYQTLINNLLREALLSERSRLDVLEERISHLEAVNSK